MSSQEERGVDFSIVAEESQQHFRLLELPPDLLQLLTSDNAPLLQFKSTQDATGNNNIVLCTPDKTYDVRQVSTSNSVFVVQDGPVTDHGHNRLPSATLQAIAHPETTLELLPGPKQSAVPYIVNLVAAYTSTGHSVSKDRITKHQLFADIPLRDAECETGWIELACFEMDENGCCALPSAQVKLSAWKSILESATAAGIDLSQPLSEETVHGTILTENDWPVKLSFAVLRSMCDLKSASGDLVVIPEVCAKAVGVALLKTLTEQSNCATSTETFQAQWRDLLPEQWREHANLTLLDGHSQLENAGHDITYRESESTNAKAPGEASSGAAKSTLGAKRKWHEKFRSAKKTS